MLPVILGLAGETLSPDEAAFFRDADPAGYILFGRNCRSSEQVRALTDALRALHGRAWLPILIDQEGGRVVRLGPPEWPHFPAAAVFGELYAKAPMSAIEAARVNGQACGLVLAELGITVNCAPNLDLRHEGAHEIVGDRSFGSDPMAVAALGRATLDGLAVGGVTGVVKHMPGHGRAEVDSHHQCPVVAADTLDDDLRPFRSLAAAKAAMVAHILYPSWDADRCASQSPQVIGQVIREEIGFGGLLLSDDIAMAALTGTPAERAKAVLAAGCDLALHGSGVLAEGVDAVRDMDAIGSDAAVRLDDVRPQPGSGDLHALLAKRDALLALI